MAGTADVMHSDLTEMLAGRLPLAESASHQRP